MINSESPHLRRGVYATFLRCHKRMHTLQRTYEHMYLNMQICLHSQLYLCKCLCANGKEHLCTFFNKLFHMHFGLFVSTLCACVLPVINSQFQHLLHNELAAFPLNNLNILNKAINHLFCNLFIICSMCLLFAMNYGYKSSLFHDIFHEIKLFVCTQFQLLYTYILKYMQIYTFIWFFFCNIQLISPVCSI